MYYRTRLEPIASLGFTAWSEGVKGPALLAAGTDDLVTVYKVVTEKVCSELPGPFTLDLLQACNVYRDSCPANILRQVMSST